MPTKRKALEQLEISWVLTMLKSVGQGPAVGMGTWEITKTQKEAQKSSRSHRHPHLLVIFESDLTVRRPWEVPQPTRVHLSLLDYLLRSKTEPFTSTSCQTR